MDAGQLRRYFSFDHRITREDLRDYPDAVVEVVNETNGPYLKRLEGKGYGLFTDRTYKKGEYVTSYGGVWGGPEVEGSYVISWKRGSLDGEYGFLPEEKGRWINDPQTSADQSPDELMTLENVNVLRDKRHVGFYATRPIEEGEELLWYYGDEYRRDWLHSATAVEEEEEDKGESNISPTTISLTTPMEMEEQQDAEFPLWKGETMEQTLRREGADEDYIERVSTWLASNGYSLATFNIAKATADPQLFAAVPRDIRVLLMRAIVVATIEDTADDPCVAAAYLMRLASNMPSMAQVLETDDSIWHRLFVHDFERFGERASWWTESLLHRAMPWRSAYLWTVFFRRRCLRELARRRGNALGKVREQIFRAIPFGTPGCVTALLVYERGWAEPRAHFQGFAGPSDLTRAGQFVYPEASLDAVQATEEMRDPHLHASPAQALYRVLRMEWSNLQRVDEIRDKWTVELAPAGTGTLAEAVKWNYGASLFAYCYLQTERFPPRYEAFLRDIFATLPDVPDLAGRLYLGAGIQ